MPLEVCFKFKPGQYVQISLFHLNYEARVLKCIYNGNHLYEVEYAVDGKLDYRTFSEDELK